MPGSLKWVKRREADCTVNDMEIIQFRKDKDIMEHNDERDMLTNGYGENEAAKENIMHVVQDRLSSFVEEHHQQPLYAEADIRWKDTGEEYTYLFKLSGDIDERTDGEIFFNCNGMEEFMDLLQKENGEDFTVKPESVVFYDKSIFTEESQAVEAEAGKQLDGYTRQIEDSKEAAFQSLAEQNGIKVGNRYRIDHLCRDNDREILNIDFKTGTVTMKECLYQYHGYHSPEPFSLPLQNVVNEINRESWYKWIRIDENRKDIKKEDTRITDVTIFTTKDGYMNIKCKIDDRQQLSKPLKQEDVRTLTDKTDRKELAGKYFSEELSICTGNTYTRKM